MKNKAATALAALAFATAWVGGASDAKAVQVTFETEIGSTISTSPDEGDDGRVYPSFAVYTSGGQLVFHELSPLILSNTFTIAGDSAMPDGYGPIAYARAVANFDAPDDATDFHWLGMYYSHDSSDDSEPGFEAVTSVVYSGHPDITQTASYLELGDLKDALFGYDGSNTSNIEAALIAFQAASSSESIGALVNGAALRGFRIDSSYDTYGGARYYLPTDGTVPEPATLALVGAGAAALAVGRSGRRS